MCGIAGWSLTEHSERDHDELVAMTRCLDHRGPDDRGYFFDDPNRIALGHTRLSIIDLSEGGHEPMVSEDRETVLIFNGEIYNFRELRHELQRRDGCRFRSECDAEVVLHGYRVWGETVVDRLRGMFAFAIWDARGRRLLLARDALGMKPLYYWATSRGVVFSSEVKAFLPLTGFSPRLDRRALDQFLEFGYTWDDERTSLEGVRKLPPGHRMSVQNGVVSQPERWFHPPLPDRTRSRAAIESELYETLQEVVSQHLVADVPVGLLLSGGLDSGIIAALAARETKVATLTMAFADSAVDERPYARIVQKAVGSEHHEVVISPGELVSDLERAVWAVDDLFADWGVVSTRLLYLKARELGLKAVLVGEGADELFGGYPSFELARGRRRAGPLHGFRLYRRLASRRYGRGYFRFAANFRRQVNESGGDLFHAIRLFETQNQLPNNFVMKVDKASMSASVEARAPFLDRRVAEIAYRTPGELLLANGTNKSLLRTMASRYKLLPQEIIERAKFGAPLAATWLDDSPELRAAARRLVLESEHSWVDAAGLRDAMTRYFDLGQRGYPLPRPLSIFQHLAWRLFLLSLWSEQYGVMPQENAA